MLRTARDFCLYETRIYFSRWPGLSTGGEAYNRAVTVRMNRVGLYVNCGHRKAYTI